MLTFEPGKDRWKLGFKEAVVASFDYLSSYGLQCVGTDVTFVKYDSPKVFVNVYHGRGSYELNVEIGRHGGPRKDVPLRLDAVLGWKRAPERKLLDREKTLFQSHTREGVQEMVPRMAALFQKYADPLLRGDEEAFRASTNIARSVPFGSERGIRSEQRDGRLAGLFRERIGNR